MPTSTRSDPLEHVLVSVLGAGEASHPYRLAMNAAGVHVIDDLMDLSKNDLQSIKWTNPTEDEDTSTPLSLTIAQVNTILSIRGWFQTQDSHDDEVFLSLTGDALRTYRRTLAAQPMEATDVTGTPTTSNALAAHSTLSAADEFKKGIKRDIRAFKVFKDRKTWNQWHRGFSATAKAQGLSDVLDPTYTPSSPSEQALFDVLQAYAFAVFTNCLIEPQAAGLVRNYTGHAAGNNDGNAQKLYADLVKVMTTGIVAKTQRSTLETKIISLRLNSKWNRGVVAFLTHFSHQLKDLQELRDPNDTSSYGDSWCITTIDNCLSTHKEMSSYVSTLAASRSSLQVAVGNNLLPLTWVDYLAQLEVQATIIDDREAKSRVLQRTVHSSQQRPGQGESRGSRGGRGGRGHGSGTRGPSNSSPNRDVTDPTVHLTNAEYRSLTPAQRRERYERKQALQLQRNANAATSNIDPAVTPPASINVNAVRTEAPSVISESVAPSAHPGTVLRQMMSSTSTRAPSTAADSITVNGVTYTRQVNSTIFYSVHESASSCPVAGSLIDGGANGGLLGSDARILETDLVHTVDATGVTNTQLTSLPIVQAASKIETVGDGPIIAILSSYAKRSDGGRTIHSKGQLESFGIIIDDRSHAVGGSQCLVTTEGYVIPLHIRDGLPYMDVSVPTDEDIDAYPHVFLTADTLWDPSILDNEFSDNAFNTPDIAVTRRSSNDPHVDPYGNVIDCCEIVPTRASSAPSLI